jgi:hypothetical protein
MTSTNPGPSGKVVALVAGALFAVAFARRRAARARAGPRRGQKEPDHGPSGKKGPSQELVWDEYKHRHALCWRLVFQTTIAAILIYVVPYVERDVAVRVRYFMVFLPVIGIALVVFALRRFLGEHDLLATVREQHWSTCKLEHSSFRRDAKWFLLALIGLGVVDIAAICIVWVPRLHCPSACA